MPDPILVAVDFSSLSERTVTYAVAIAVARGVAIDLLHITSGTPASRGLSHMGATDVLEEIRREEHVHAERELDQLMERLVPQGARGRCLVEPGQPAEQICRVAGQGYELVVVSTHGRTGLKQILIGSVAERVVRLAPIPVLVVR